MIDLFSIVFSTGMVMLVIFRAIRHNAAGDSYPDARNEFGALKDGLRTNRDGLR